MKTVPNSQHQTCKLMSAILLQSIGLVLNCGILDKLYLEYGLFTFSVSLPQNLKTNHLVALILVYCNIVSCHF